MYCTQKINKNLIIARFIVATKKCITRVISTTISKAFKLIFYQIQGFYNKSYFYSSFQQIAGNKIKG